MGNDIDLHLGKRLRRRRRLLGLTQQQLDIACSNRETKLPAGLKPHFCE